MMRRMIWIFLLVMLVIPMADAQDDELPRWDGESRFTVLVMGMDRRPSERGSLQVRTDAILIVSVDPERESIGVLHIPRDVHFVPPDRDDFLRVNTLLIHGEDIDYGYGPLFALETLQYNLGMYIDRYVLFDFQAFTTLVDAIGGVEITTTYSIYDPTYPDMYGGYDPFRLPAGTHTLDGEDALKFARTRHGDNDYVRGVRQMQVALAVMDRLRDLDTLGDLMTSAPRLLRQLQNNVLTDMTIDEMVQLGLFAVEVEPENITTGSMNEAYIMLYALPSGRNAYIPDRTKLVDLLVSVFGEHYAP